MVFHTAPGCPYKYLPIVYLVLEVVGSHELLWYCGCIDHDAFCSIHEVVQVEILYIHTNLSLYYDIDNDIGT